MENINRPLLNTMLGKYYGNKLVNFLSECCLPRISINFTATCDGIDIKGNPKYDITASVTYNVNISGYTAISYYISDQPFPNIATPKQSGTFIVGAIKAGVPIIVEDAVVDNPNPGNYYLMITDNRGNYSFPLTASFPNCL